MRSEDALMTWTQQVKEELIHLFTKSEKRQKAELTAIMILNPQCIRYDDESGLYLYEESIAVDKNIFTVKHKTYNIKGGIDLEHDPDTLYKDMESKRAFLRGAFLASGSFTDPEKSYQFELIADYKWQAEKLQKLMAFFNITSKTQERREKYVVYLKDAEAISDMLNVIGAHKTLMAFENIRIMKEMRGVVNRQVNCETANINKTVAASMKQLEDIKLIEATIGVENLDENLRKICQARLEHPDAGLSELGNLMVPSLGKSGVNHRFRKLSEMADKIRDQQGNSI